ncbi:uncharacterized protein LOC111394655 isoform X2 [Olea europaea subsp. europaea]|uniref:Uncharacterized protein LOC111394655 isoform X2 n=1 Tax=Olea europaea subsp. europaea TaxID=158383 RepID=A0A8S0V158_OLEEU|nr:uncharacterized protein LOC111394655 isoform X2 [Olea europaea subsp. europaea]
MASLYLLKSSPSTPSISSPSIYRRKFSCFCWEFNSRFRYSRIVIHNRRSRVYCKNQESENKSNGEERPESLFMKELKRRGMTPTSLLEEKNKSIEVDDQMKFKEEDRSFSPRNAVRTDSEINLFNQREQSMELNSEGLEYFGPSFVHNGSEISVSSPQYKDPYELLEEERIYQTAPSLN